MMDQAPQEVAGLPSTKCEADSLRLSLAKFQQEAHSLHQVSPACPLPLLSSREIDI